LPVLVLEESPSIPGVSPAEIHYREWGNGDVPLIFLHGGWGYRVFPFDRQVQSFGADFRMIAPDRSGYGLSTRIEELQPDFHRCAATETMYLLDSLGIERSVLWGHSDGAVIAAIMGLAAPQRFAGVILEAIHFDRSKSGSRGFFETMVSQPESLGERVCATLALDHGADYWRKVLEAGGRAWLRIIEESDRPEKDLYEGRLSDLRVPAVLLHGSKDPRTEPGELVMIHSELPRVPIRVIENAGHSPHSEREFAEECNRLAGEFLLSLR
jgi:pimeloyl-ACP methyl ester carboxylesterase